MFRKWSSIMVMLGLFINLGLFIGCSEDDDEGTGGGGPSGGPVILSGTIVEDMTLTAVNEYLLRGGVFVGVEVQSDDGADAEEVVLTIEPGTTIYGESSSAGMLVIRRGSKIMAEGTSTEPIVFTSDKEVGNRQRGDWGGLIINGRATLNTGAKAIGEGGTGSYGGTDDTDDSGILRYVRVEFAGREISPDNELNGIALQGVGNGTTIEYVQVHMNKDDGIEFFGGTATAKYVYITGAADDQFDWTDGWRGKGQFWVCQQYGDDADQGIEADNNGENNEAIPRSHPTIYNLTLVGDAAGAESDIGILLREGTAAEIKNAIVINFGDCGIDIDHAATFNNATDDEGATLNGNLIVDNSIFYNTADWQSGEDGENDESEYWFTTETFISTLNTSNTFDDPMLTAALSKTNPDFTPLANSPVLTSTVATPPSDNFFEAVNFIGGVDPNNNWIAGWTTAEME